MICGHPKPLLLGMLTTLVNFMNSPMLVQLYLNCLVKIKNLNLLGFLLIDDASGFLNANICLMVFKVIGPLWILLCWLPVVAKLMNLAQHCSQWVQQTQGIGTSEELMTQANTMQLEQK